MTEWLDRTLIAVTGPHARMFLQNLLTQDLDRLTTGSAIHAALLSPQGKISADMFVWARTASLLLDVDSARGSDLLRKLQMYKLRADVDLEDVSHSIGVCVSEAPFEGAVLDPRLAQLGYRGLGVRGPAGAPTYDARRLALGVPDLARDAAPEEVFALEGLLEELHGVDFQKGCFVGQENVSRMKRRATTRKKFCPVVFDGEAPAYGTAIRAGEAELGSIRSGAAGRALALLRLDRALSAEAPLRAGETELRLDPPAWLLLPPRAA